MRYRSGQRVPVSGQYAIIDPYGRNTGYEVTVVSGEPFHLPLVLAILSCWLIQQDTEDSSILQLKGKL